MKLIKHDSLIEESDPENGIESISKSGMPLTKASKSSFDTKEL